jgi:hypothetical protein
MSSYPLKVWKTFRREQSEAPNSEEYQPLANDPSAPEPERTGADQQMPKPETRKGDLLAEWAAYVRPSLILPFRTVLTCPRCLPQYVHRLPYTLSDWPLSAA